MLRNRQPTYEVNFLERLGGKGQFDRRWVSAAISGFNGGSSRHEQVERILGELGTQILEGDFSMRRMTTQEVRTLRRKNRQIGGTPITRTREVGGLKARVAYPEGRDLERVSDSRRESVAASIACAEAIQQGVVIDRAVFNCGDGSGPITKAEAAREEAVLRGEFGLMYEEDGQSASPAAIPPAENAAGI